MHSVGVFIIIIIRLYKMLFFPIKNRMRIIHEGTFPHLKTVISSYTFRSVLKILAEKRSAHFFGLFYFSDGVNGKTVVTESYRLLIVTLPLWVFDCEYFSF